MRLFVAVWPSPEVVDVLRHGIERPTRPGLRWTTPDQWHVTLRFLGNVDADALPPLEHALAGVAAAHDQRQVRLGPTTRRLGRSILVVPVHGLGDLAAAVVDATRAVGEPPDDRPFTGHLTLARGARTYDQQSLEAAWTANELTLVRSHTDRSGARYDVLARWPLSGGGATSSRP